METVANLASTASRVIWGDQPKATETANNETGGREPIAGETGDVKAGEPYDKGNMDGATEDLTDKLSASHITSSTTDDPLATSSNPFTPLPSSTESSDPVHSEHETDKTGVASFHNPVAEIPSDKPTSLNDTSTVGPTPFIGSDPSSGVQNTQKQQGADRPFEEPVEGSEEHERIKETVREAEEAAKIDISGPVPVPLENKAKENSQNVGGTNGDGLQNESHGEGTGEKYIKSTGLQADGGDFDAANAGAAREADRLLEEQGVHHTTEIAPPKEEVDTKEEKNGKEGKVSLKDKIKAKLHKH